MNGFLIMVKNSIKILLRNPAFLVCMITIPVLATLMLNLQYEETVTGNDKNSIILVEGSDISVVNVEYSKLSVLVFDNSKSESSNWLINQLNYTGLYKIYLYEAEEFHDDMGAWALDFMNENTIKTVLYIPSDFEGNLIMGYNSGLCIFEGNDDDRISLLKSGTEDFLGIIQKYSQLGKDESGYYEMLHTSLDNQFDIEAFVVIRANEFNLTDDQNNDLQNIAFAIAILSLAYVLSGIFGSNVIINEKRTNVLKRVRLSNSSVFSYALAKLILACIITILQTFIAGVSIMLLTKGEFGISWLDFIVFAAGLGIVFNTMCVICGILSDNVLNALYFTFGAWIITNTLSGVYFPSMDLTGWIGEISKLTPQRWVLLCSKMLMSDGANVYGVYSAIIFAFLAVILVFGIVLYKSRERK